MTTTADDQPEVLLVEDHPEDRDLLDLACRRGGLAVRWRIATTLRDFRAALDAIRAGAAAPPVLAILDIRLPDGFSTDLLPRWAEELPSVPVVLFSSSPTPPDDDTMGVHGQVTYLVKPATFAGYGEIVGHVGRALATERHP